ILIIDDEAQIRRLLRLTLEEAGHKVREAATGRLGLDEAIRRAPGAVVLDMGLPDLSGLEVLQQLRSWSRGPVRMLTVRSARADDYLTKPCGSAELTARVRAVLRRAPAEAEQAAVKFGDIVIDLPGRVVRRGGADVKLTPKEFALLRLLVLHRGKVLTHGQILR